MFAFMYGVTPVSECRRDRHCVCLFHQTPSGHGREAQAADANLRQLLADIEHMDGGTRVCDPVHLPRAVALNRAARVEVSRAALDVLRRARSPVTLRDIAYAFIAKGVRVRRTPSRFVR